MPSSSSSGESSELPPLEEIEAELARRELLEFIQWASPKYEQPRHLQPLINALERINAGEEVRECFHAPPRHAKTDTVLHGLAWLLKNHDDWPLAYVTYVAKLAEEKSKKASAIAARAGVSMERLRQAKDNWRTGVDEGGLYATGIGGPFIGRGVRVLVVDDYHKNRVEAESATMRERNWDWLSDVGETRIEPGGSVLVFAHRWHPDDLIGRLVKAGWKYNRMPAISDDGKPLWPERWPLKTLLEKRSRLTSYTWESIYQGRPRPRGATVFGEPAVWSELPRVFRTGQGLDLAYTAKTHADHSVIVTMLAAGDVFYVVEVVRKQLRAPEFQQHIRASVKRFPRGSMRIYKAGGPETGATDFIRAGELGIKKLVGIDAIGDKFVRAQPYAASWNDNRVLVPASKEVLVRELKKLGVTSPDVEWVDEFVAEHAGFTGVDDDADDQVDAGAACHDELDESEDADVGETKPKRAKNAPPSTRNLAM